MQPARDALQEIDLELIDLVPRRSGALEDEDINGYALQDLLLDHLMHERSIVWHAREARRKRDVA